jgi:membrane protease YdiL (CAAX protease family)
VPPPDDAPTRVPPRTWGIGQVVVGYVVAFLTSSIGVGGYLAVTGGSSGRITLGLAITALVSLWVGLFGTVLYVTRRRAHASMREELGLAFQWVDLPVGAAVGLASQLWLLWLVYLPLRLASPRTAHRLDKPAKDLTNAAHGPGYVVLAVLIVVGTPLVEELFFRGLLQRSLLRRMGPVAAVAVSAVAFGLAHEQLLQLPGLIAFGLVLGALAWRTGRLGPGIVAHAFFNLVTVVALALSR